MIHGLSEPSVTADGLLAELERLAQPLRGRLLVTVTRSVVTTSTLFLGLERFLPRTAASCAIRPGTSFRAVKLLPMKSTFSGALPRTRVAISSSAFSPK